MALFGFIALATHNCWFDLFGASVDDLFDAFDDMFAWSRHSLRTFFEFADDLFAGVDIFRWFWQVVFVVFFVIVFGDFSPFVVVLQFSTALMNLVCVSLITKNTKQDVEQYQTNEKIL